MNISEVFIRDNVAESDRDEVVRLCRRVGNLSPVEVDIAEEVLVERLVKGEASGYRFRLAQGGDRLLGYICYGLIPCSDSSWDIYWLVVDPAYQKLGLGTWLIREAEQDAARSGGALIYVETSSRPDYQPARSFYRHQGYSAAAELVDFYRPGDNKIIFEKRLPAVCGS